MLLIMSPLSKPKVTVLMSLYNSADTVRQSVLSILNQTFSFFNLLIINDASSDNSLNIINDISGLTFDAKLARVVAKRKATLVIMHMLGKPKTMQKNPKYKDMMNEIYGFLEKQVAFAVCTGIDRDRIVVDPGLGFGKKLEDNYTIMRRLAEFKGLHRPIMVGHSRKSFIGKPFKLAPENRLEGSLAVQALLINNGASILRVHDVMEARKAAELIDLIQR